MRDQIIQLMIFKLVNDPDAFTICELDNLKIALRRRALK
jgi:hypothetical protein